MKVRRFLLPVWYTGTCMVLVVLFFANAVTSATPQSHVRFGLNATTPAFNNNGIVPDTTPGAGNFDTWGTSYSNDALAASGFVSGNTVTSNGVTFQWPTVAAGTPDNWQASGQVIPITSTGSIAFLGAASNGPSQGTAIVTYTDGTTQNFTLTFSDWTLNGGTTNVLTTNTIAATLPYRDNGSGKDNVKTYVFFTSLPLPAGKTAQSVTLPTTVSAGQLHVFAVAAGAAQKTTYTNEGIVPDSSPGSGNFDTWGTSYSNDALTTAGFASGGTVQVNGATFNWPTVTVGQNDNWVANGEVVPVTATGTLALLGAASNGPSAGTATITYTDGSTQAFTLAFSDWTLNGGGATVVPADSIAVTLPYRDNGAGKQNTKTYIFYTATTLAVGKTTQSVTLPTNVTSGQLHVFAVAQGAAPKTTFSNDGIVPDSAPGSGNFDTWGTSYSNDALTAAGFASGSNVTVNGTVFSWPTIISGQNNNWQAAGQTIPVTATGTLAFLGAASNGPSSGTATITYTDGSTQQFNLAFSDWTLNGGTANVLTADSIAVTLPYRDNGSGKNNVQNYVFMSTVTLTAGKTTASVTLPTTVTAGQLHVFAVAQGKAPAPVTNWSMYGYDLAHDFNNTQETSISVASAPNLSLITSIPDVQTQGNNFVTGISGQVATFNGNLYYGSWDGYFRAATPAGKLLWSIFIGQLNIPTCVPAIAGIGGTPTYAVVNGIPTIYIAGGNGWMYALNANTGAVIWSTLLGDTNTGYYIWDSPEVYNGSVYIGVSSYGDCPNIPGTLNKLDWATGAVQGVFNIVPQGCTGGGQWGTPTIDTAAGVIYIATGNLLSCSYEPYAQAVVAVNAATMQPIATWQIPLSLADATGDADFGNTATLFSATINGQVVPMVGVTSKDGQFSAFQRVTTNFTGTWTPVWNATVSDPGDCPDCDSGSVSPAAFDGQTLYVGGGRITVNGVTYASVLEAINPATGAFIWRQFFTDGPILGATTLANGVVAVGHGPTITLHNAATGAILFHFTDPATNAAFYGAITMANGRVYAANMDGTIYIFG